MTDTALELASLAALTNDQGNDIPDDQLSYIFVQFNPDSLDLTYNNSVQKGNRRQPPQIISETTAKLSMELVFDTTLNGIDVRLSTFSIAALMDPRDPRQPTRRNNSRGVPAKVLFEWGTFSFEGYIESIKEKLDYFSSTGVPLRSTLTVAMTDAQRNLIPSSQDENDPVDTSGDLNTAANTQQKPLGGDQSLNDLTQQLGDVNAARMLGEINGLESIRLPEIDSVAIVDVSARSSSSFSSGISTSSVSASSMIGTNSGFSSSVSSSNSVSTESLFGGLKAGASQSALLTPKANLSANASISASLDVGIGIEAGIEIGIGLEAGLSLTADVGVDKDFSAGIKFEECKS